MILFCCFIDSKYFYVLLSIVIETFFCRNYYKNSPNAKLEIYRGVKVATHHNISLTEDGKHALKYLGGDPGDSVKKVLLDIFLP